MPGHVTKRVYKRRDPDTGKLKPTGVCGWQARYPNPTNPTKEIVKTFPTKRDAERWLTDQRASIQRGQFIDPRKADRPLADVIAAWQESWHDLSPSTRSRYREVIRQ